MIQHDGGLLLVERHVGEQAMKVRQEGGVAEFVGGGQALGVAAGGTLVVEQVEAAPAGEVGQAPVQAQQAGAQCGGEGGVAQQVVDEGAFGLGHGQDVGVGLWSGGMTYRRTFPGRADQIPEARRFVRFLLEGSPRRDDAEQIVAELAANAVARTASGQPHGTFIVEVARRISAIRVSPSTTAAGERPRGSLGAAAPIRSPRTAGAWHWSPAWPYGSVCGGHRRWATRSGPSCLRGEHSAGPP
ncbi:ATP-binding protein [Streptosporangium sandarakinum]